MSDHPYARRRSNEDRVLALLTRVGQASRGELARDLGLPKATVADLAAVVLSVPAPFQRGVGSAVTVPAPGPGETGRQRAAWPSPPTSSGSPTRS